MDFDLTDEHRMIRDLSRDFADEVIVPRGEEMERTGEYPYDIIDQMAGLGMMGIPFPEEYGGSGGDWVGMHVCIEEISRGDITLGALLDVTTSVAGQEIFVFGTEEQKQRWLTPIAQGKAIGAFGLTEPDSGSDAGSLRTTAVQQGDEWVLNGTKQFVTNIGLKNASVLLVAAKTGEDKKGNIISAFIVPKDTPGFTLGKRYEKMSWKASATHEVILEECRIPNDYVLGDPRRGFAHHLSVLETGRISMAAMSVGVAQACLDESVRYAKERVQFGKPIFDFQGVQFKLADMAVSIELARNQYLKAAWLKDQGRKHTFEATVAKLYATEMAEKVASDALQIHGGYGYMDEYPVSRYYKAVKLMQIVEGTSEVQRMILGRILGS
ncbi:MAG: acyl-CoA dehydrogenase family protein [Deltaproteobacteria bacterium]|nr:acyl-CoA dehydrogenase family protein [Deltaproteobacteria bacterium]MBW1924414.1 acyl-CoA dehydrogenase family protein [Deltaproteobacteria bacterium]MBW1948252.1 acyl-CoA dehydrogenase family protein [Deltaproteobacteria bacterium]MBW2007828.1 acyl-CoA dehydrogenase family protein [Deltaproteobacteria bacterium]MBW2101744.1 acyl-CoA dehydrogenase family protein [Deltaproteobacteria bacterium]